MANTQANKKGASAVTSEAHLHATGTESPALAVRERIEAELEEAEFKAWDALGRYKFQMFGYWAAIWVHLNRIGDFKRRNPWKSLVKVARGKVK